MIITFCGHANFNGTKEYEKKIIDFLQKNIGNTAAEIYLGGYGNFDNFAYDCCKNYKKNHPRVSLVFVTPYIDIYYQKKHLEYYKTAYDSIIYPEIENKPPRFAISYRNRYMVEKADWVVAYVNHKWGGAYATYKYAKKKCKCILNLAEAEI